MDLTNQNSIQWCSAIASLTGIHAELYWFVLKVQEIKPYRMNIDYGKESKEENILKGLLAFNRLITC